MSLLQNYYLGCPIWANKDWTGTLFAPKAKPKDYLKQYARVFNTVEGSNTFYALPGTEQVLRWKSDTPTHFRFSFKLPQTITHVYKLRHVQQELTRFFMAMEPLLERIGMFFIQLPPTFNKKSLPALAAFIKELPHDLTYALEVRHLDFYQNDDTETALNSLLQQSGINRALFDTATLHALPPADAHIVAAQRKKTKMPPRLLATAQNPFLRFVGHALPQQNAQRLTQIAQTAAQWLAEGKHPYLFMHTPGDEFAPQTCRFFHQLLLQCRPATPVGSIAPFAGEQSSEPNEQMSLF